MSRRAIRWTLGVTVCLAASLAISASATAAIRYAGPGGTGADPCASPATPCSIYKAADVNIAGTTIASGDEVVIAPGSYTAADLGPNATVQLPSGVSVHGAAGEPRPEITNESPNGIAFIISDGSILSHIELSNITARDAIWLFGGTLAGSIVRGSSTTFGATPCVTFDGTIRDSVCTVDNPNFATALGGGNQRCCAHTVTLRNVTATATGTGSKGLSFAEFGGSTLAVSAKSVIAKGGQTDVVAGGFGTGMNNNTCPCSSVTVTLDHSNYATVSATHSAAGGSATVTAAGTGTNQVQPPLFASDGFHQLANSPTVNAGATDGLSGTADIDGQARVIDTADIGADEFAHATTTSVACAPASVQLGTTPGATTCTATVTDTTGAIVPSGVVNFTTASPGALSAPSCTLVGTTMSSASCFVTYTPNAVASGTHTVNAAYPGDGSHEGSQGSGNVAVTPAAKPPASRPQTVLLKKPARRTTNRMARFTFRSKPAGATFQCKLDRKPFRKCSSPFKRRVKPGKHVFKVRAVGPGGADKTPAVYRWKVLRKH
jgi:hypothetical protein